VGTGIEFSQRIAHSTSSRPESAVAASKKPHTNAPQSSLADSDALLMQRPEHGKALFMRANTLVELKRQEEAIDIYA